MAAKEFRVTFQREVGHQRQTRLYQRELAALTSRLVGSSGVDGDTPNV